MRDKLGRWMIFSAWLLILLLLTAFFSNWLDYRQNPNRLLQVRPDQHGNTLVMLQRNSAGHYTAPGSINGEPVNFLLDTGATQVALSDELANRIGLRRFAMQSMMTANGPVQSWSTSLERVELGPIIMFEVQAAIIPTLPANEVLLGMSFLKHLELIQQGKQLIIRAP